MCLAYDLRYGTSAVTDTVSGRKDQTQVKGCFGTVSGIFSGLSGMEAEGYEIHMGETSSVGGDIVKNVIKEAGKAVNHSLIETLGKEQAGKPH